MHPEKNYVDISKLFNWGGELTILDDIGVEVDKLYVRLVGDAELNRARVIALRSSAELRKKLKDENSDEYFAFIPLKELVDKDKIVELILLYSTREITREVVKNMDLAFPKNPKSTDSLEEMEKFQKEVDEYTSNKDRLTNEEIVKKLNELKKFVQEKEEDSLYKDLVNTIANELCEQEMLRKFNEACAFYGTYADKEYKIRLFKDFEDFLNLPTNIKNQIIDFYSTLEIDSESLKK